MKILCNIMLIVIAHVDLTLVSSIVTLIRRVNDFLSLKLSWDQANGKVKIFFDIDRLYFDLFRFQSRFRTMWIGL